MLAAFSGPRATQLVLATPPSGVAGASFAVQPVLELRDARGRLAVGCGGAIVRASLVSGPGAIIGTATATADNAGTVAFSGFGVSTAGTYAIRFQVQNRSPLVDASGLVIGAGSAISRAAVVVTVKVSARSVLTGVVPYPNEPSGMILGQLNPLNAAYTTSGGIDSYSWGPSYDATWAAVTDPLGVRGTVLRCNYPAGSPGGGAPQRLVGPQNFRSRIRTATGNGSTLCRRVYASFYIALSANWTNNGNTGTKFMFFRSTLDNGDQNHYINLSNPTSPLDLGMGLQWGVGTDYPGGFAAGYPSSAGFPAGAWVRVEIFLQVNTPGVDNGIGRVWVNGTQTLNQTALRFYQTGQVADWGFLYFDPTYGGGTNAVPADQAWYIDDWYTSLGE